MYTPAIRFPRPSKVLIGVMVGLTCLWIAFAAGINWVHSPGAATVFEWLAGSDEGMARGQVWRLFTAPLLHHPNQPWHLLGVLLVLYFFATPLEQKWGKARLWLIVAGGAVGGFLIQLLIGAIIPAAAPGVWFGGLAGGEALIVAWALSAREGEQVRLFFVLPVSARGLIVFALVMAALNLLARNAMPEGLIAPFGGMLIGYLASERSPARRLWLKLKLRRMRAEVAVLERERRARGKAASHLRVIRGGRDDDDPHVLH